MWWMYIGLGVVVALFVIFLFAMLAYSSTDMGESHGDSQRNTASPRPTYRSALPHADLGRHHEM